MSFKLGLDYYGTIDRNPRAFAKLAHFVMAAGGTVHIITAVYFDNIAKVGREIATCGVPHNGFEVVTFGEGNDYHAVPAKKLGKAQDLKLDLFIDDREDTCRLFNERGILALRSIV